VKKSNVGECAIIHGHFRPKMMPYFSFQFSLHFGEKTFWWVKGENTWLLLFILLPPHPTKHTPKKFSFPFFFKVFHLPCFPSKKTHPKGHFGGWRVFLVILEFLGCILVVQDGILLILEVWGIG